MKPSIAIDGPAGAGKSTVARTVAQRLGLTYLDTGAMYRAITLAALRQDVDLLDAGELAILASRSGLEIRNNGGTDNQNMVFLDGDDVTEDIRLPEVSRNVSFVARCPDVREVLVDRQRQIGKRGGVVMDGRDIGTNVMPEAEYKFFLTASLAERARRRQTELAAKGENMSLPQMMNELAARDRIDSERECSPLCPAHDAIHIDTTELTIEQVVQKIADRVGKC
ncbi:MAG: (d)CMP kinase [Dethiobacter sp.]|nr:(d)CMP kinase [Dethiobacter sp.]